MKISNWEVLGLVEQSLKAVLTSINTGDINDPTIRQLDIGMLNRALLKIRQYEEQELADSDPSGDPELSDIDNWHASEREAEYARYAAWKKE